MRHNRAQIALIAVAVLHTLSPLVVRGVHAGFGWDETTYLSQINRFAPAGVFSAPRARGLTLLVAPITLLTTSVAALRVWLALLSGFGLWVAFRPWLRLRDGYVVPVAALLWSGLWVTIYYGFEAMPNEYSALGAVAATGWLLVALRGPEASRSFIWSGIAVAFVALIRPTDALCLGLALIAVMLAVRGRGWRLRAAALAAVVVGFAAGVAEWVIEAYVRFGGPSARLRAASAENLGGLHWSLGAQWRALAGPILCRGGCVASSPSVDQVWWPVLAVLVIVGVWAARRRHEVTPYAAAIVVALAIAAQYVVGIAYAAPRFLLPTYALLVLPAAEAVCWLVRLARPAWRPVGIAVLAAAFIAQSIGQIDITRNLNDHANLIAAGEQQVSAALKAEGVHAPCGIAGFSEAPIAYLAGCTDLPRRPGIGQIDNAIDDSRAAVALIQRSPHTRLDTCLSGWSTYAVRTHGDGALTTWVSRPSGRPVKRADCVRTRRHRHHHHRHDHRHDHRHHRREHAHHRDEL